METEPRTRVNSTSSLPKISTDILAENKDSGLSSTVVLPENCNDTLAGQLTWIKGPWLEIHRNLASYVLQTVRHRVNFGLEPEILRLSKQWAQWDILTCLANYHPVMKILLGYLEDQDFPDSNVVATIISDHLSRDIPLVLGQITSTLGDSQNYKRFLACTGSLAQQLLDLIQDLLDLSYEWSSKPLLWKALLRLSRKSGLHPTCFNLSRLEKVGQQMAGGGFGDIWRGLVDGQTVAVKSIRIFLKEDVQIALKEFGREALIWRQLSHPNLLPFFGLYTLDGRLSLVSPWMENGHLQQYLKECPRDIDRLSLILDVAMGLEYLHKNRIVHGDLKSPNVLVAPSGRACIADFGMSSIDDVMSLKIAHSTRSILGGTAKYQAPELLTGASLNHFGSDVYAFACIGYEILTGAPPFSELANEMAVGIKVIEGKRPSRPQIISSDALWALLERCWQQEQAGRPIMLQVLGSLLSSPISAMVKHFERDWDETYSAKFRRSVQQWPLLPTVAEIEHGIIHGFNFFDHKQPKVALAISLMASGNRALNNRGRGVQPDRGSSREIQSREPISFPPRPIPADPPNIMAIVRPYPTVPVGPGNALDSIQPALAIPHPYGFMKDSPGSARVTKSKNKGTTVLSKMKSWWTKPKSTSELPQIHGRSAVSNISDKPILLSMSRPSQIMADESILIPPTMSAVHSSRAETIFTKGSSMHTEDGHSIYMSPSRAVTSPLPAQVSNLEDIIEPFMLRSTSPPISIPRFEARETSETTLRSTTNNLETPPATMVLERYASEATERLRLTPPAYISYASPASSSEPGDPQSPSRRDFVPGHHTRREKVLVDTQRSYNSSTSHGGGESVFAIDEVIGRMGLIMSPASERPRLNPPAYSPYASPASSPEPGDPQSASRKDFAPIHRTRLEKASVDTPKSHGSITTDEDVSAIDEVIRRMGLTTSPDSDSESVVGSTIGPHTDSTGQSRLSSPPVLTTQNGLET